jgi:prevent-host-death family protein
MKHIGVRELRQRASEYLREVERGTAFEVTAHGRPVARLVPVRAPSKRAELIVAGRLAAGQGDILALGAPLKPRKGGALPSVALAEARDQER